MRFRGCPLGPASSGPEPITANCHVPQFKAILFGWILCLGRTLKFGARNRISRPFEGVTFRIAVGRFRITMARFRQVTRARQVVKNVLLFRAR